MAPALIDGSSWLKTDDIPEMLSGVQSIRERQDKTDNLLIAMQQENAVLWKEIASLRHKHAKQQAVVDKLCQFLMSIVSSARGMKRKSQLMIDGGDTSLPFGDTNGNKRLNSSTASGPVIHDITNDIDADLEAVSSSEVITQADVLPTVVLNSQPGIESLLNPEDILDTENVLSTSDILDPLTGIDDTPLETPIIASTSPSSLPTTSVNNIETTNRDTEQDNGNILSVDDILDPLIDMGETGVPTTCSVSEPIMTVKVPSPLAVRSTTPISLPFTDTAGLETPTIDFSK